MKQKIALILVLVMIAATMTACGGSAASTEKYAMDAPSAEAPMMAPMPEAEMKYDYEMGVTEESMDFMEADPNTAGGLGDGNAAPANTARKLIRNVDLSLETREFDKAVEEINALVSRLGGYIEYSDISGRSLDYRGDYYRRSANFVARIPAEKLGEATGSIEEICNVTSRSESVNDITDTYYDVDGRLRTLRVEEERLLALLEKAEKLEDMLTIESHLSNVRYQIESLTGQLNRYDSQVNYSTVSMYLQEVVEYTEKQVEPIGFGQRIGQSFKNSLSFIAEFGEGLVITLVTVLPFLLVYGGIAAVVVVIVIKAVRRGRRSKKAKAAQAEAAPKTDETNN